MSVAAVSKRLSDLGEGPFWDPASQRLYHVDAFVGDVCRLNPVSGETETVNLGDTVTVAIPFVNNPRCLLVTRRKELYSLEFDSKIHNFFAIVDKRNPKSRFNDGKCDSKGRFWGGTLVEDRSSYGNLWMLDPASYQFQSFAKNIVLSNGLTWSLDNKILYFVDSEEKVIYTFDFDLETPSAGNQNVLVDFKKNSDYSQLGVPDGMTIDTEGKIWVACFGGGCVIQINPENGKILRKVQIPAKETTSCCFGGPNFDVLFVTSSSRHLTEKERNDQPQSGAVFAVTGLGVRGFPAHGFDSSS